MKGWLAVFFVRSKTIRIGYSFKTYPACKKYCKPWLVTSTDLSAVANQVKIAKIFTGENAKSICHTNNQVIVWPD
jgi:hypothetical protein